MDLRWLLLVAVVMGIIGFLLGRRTSPGGRAVHRLQREIDAKQQALTHHQDETSRFVADMQNELEHVSSAYRDLQAKLRSGAEHLAGSRQTAVVAATSAKRDVSVPTVVAQAAAPMIKRPALRQDSDSPEWSARLAGSWGDVSGGPSLASAAACPLPEHQVTEAPKDYPAPRRNSSFDEHSYA